MIVHLPVPSSQPAPTGDDMPVPPTGPTKRLARWMLWTVRAVTAATYVAVVAVGCWVWFHAGPVAAITVALAVMAFALPQTYVVDRSRKTNLRSTPCPS